MTDTYSNTSMFIPLLSLLYAALILVGLSSLVVVEAMMTPEDSVSSQWTDYPFFVVFLSPMLCGGVLLSTNPAWVLTAGHCVKGTSSKDTAAVQVKVLDSASTSSSSWKEQGQTREIIRLIKHPSKDIAVAQLTSSPPIRYASPIPIYSLLSSQVNQEETSSNDDGDTIVIGKNGIFVGVGYQSIELPAGQDAPRSAKTLQQTNLQGPPRRHRQHQQQQHSLIQFLQRHMHAYVMVTLVDHF
ncbi:hypothetical protein BDB00DRAFT_891311 [Zychaea mexicana]|uniref:uncharacterized protein n=1 Tax=Zychaea mexicana TaxID=64656 RepID=UPI0022FE943B|nr:uncharacterized protein BDB00DRAFT_891311 [Zychaea mexicana]KAI9496687.1 hypothetical protein BDB00DRAFT_891311 [Zychaea mexicana]